MRPRDKGSATVLVIGAIGALVALMLGALALISAAEASTRARTAADLGALAGADRLVGGGAGEPCAVARSIVRANEATLLTCTVAGSVVELETAVSSSWLGLGAARARSRAGPAPDTIGP